MERPGLKRLLADVRSGKVDVIVVYKVDRLTRALSDFAKIVDILDAAEASFVSITQAFNTTTSMGRLTLNVLLSFAQFEREVISERVRDKIAASIVNAILPTVHAEEPQRLLPAGAIPDLYDLGTAAHDVCLAAGRMHRDLQPRRTGRRTVLRRDTTVRLGAQAIEAETGEPIATSRGNLLRFISVLLQEGL
jgi:DNA invertase Pin-like site-specific DNA recombinase